MIYKNTELFNVEEISETKEFTKIYRFPQDVFSKMNGREAALLTTGCEIRFIGEASVTVGAVSSVLDGYGRVEVYRGDRFYWAFTFPVGQKCAIKLCYDTNADNYYDNHNKVWRVVFGHYFQGVIYDIEPIGEIRPPKKGELYSKTMVAYGSSITHGDTTICYSDAHIFKLSEKLGVDIENKGVRGECMCEKEVADFFANKKYDIMYMELGINMMGRFTPLEYYERAFNLISQLDKDTPVIFISPYRHFRSLSKDNAVKVEVKSYAETARRIYNDLKRDNVYFIDGLEIVDNLDMLSCDLIHPAVYGHQLMCDRIYDKLKKAFDGRG